MGIWGSHLKLFSYFRLKFRDAELVEVERRRNEAFSPSCRASLKSELVRFFSSLCNVLSWEIEILFLNFVF